MRTSLIVIALMLLSVVNAFSQQSLTTTFVSNNNLISSQNGTIFFDIENVSPVLINITSWDINIRCLSGTNLQVYYREGTSQGFENTMDGWILLGTETNIVCAGKDNPTPLSIGGLTIDSGETKGFAMVEVNPDMFGGEWFYTNGTGSNEVYNNGEIELTTEFASGNFPGIPFGPRVWNGTVYYEFIFPPRNVPTLSEWGLIAMASILGLAGYIVILRKKTIV